MTESENQTKLGEECPPGHARGEEGSLKARLLLDAAALALTPLTVLLQGHRFGLGNHAPLISYIRREDNPGWLIRDWMMSTPPIHPHFVDLLHFFTTYIGENFTFLLAHLLTRLFLLMGVWRLTAALLPGRHAVAFFAMAAVFLEPRFQLGYHFLQGGHWEPSFLGMAFAVWIGAVGIRYAEGRNHWTALAVVGGFGIIAHLFINLPVFVLTLAGAAWRRREWKLPTAAGLAGLFIGSVTLVPAVRGFFFPGEAPLSSQEVIQLLQFRHPHHHQPWLWPVMHYVQAALVLAGGAFAWWRLLRHEQPRRLLIPGILLAYFVVSCLAFVVFGRLQVLAVVAYSQSFRILSLFLLLALIAAFAWISKWLEGRSFWLVGFAAAVLAVVFRLVPWQGPLLVAAYLFVLPLSLRGAPVGRALPKALLCFLLPASFVAGAVGIALLQSSPDARDWVNGLRSEHWLREVRPRDPARRELAQWVRRNTHPEALFAIPPTMKYFRLYEERAIVVDFKSVPYKNADLEEWAERIKDGSNVDPYARFTAMPAEWNPPPEHLIEFGKKYGARYAVVRKSMDHPAAVFQNEKYTVIDLEEQVRGEK